MNFYLPNPQNEGNGLYKLGILLCWDFVIQVVLLWSGLE